MQPRQDRLHRLLRGLTRLDLFADEVRDHLGVGLAGERAAPRDQFLSQRLEIFDDAVVDHRDMVGGVRVRVVRGRTAMRRPARVRDPDAARQRIGGQFLRKIDELA